MKFTQKNVFLIIVFLLGIITNYNAYFQYGTTSLPIELISENNSTLNGFSPDSEKYQEDQITYNRKTISSGGVNHQPSSYVVTSLLNLPSFTIWQPPKNS